MSDREAAMICEHDGCTDEAQVALGAGGLAPEDGPSAHLRVCLAHVEEGAADLLAAVLHAHGHDHPRAAPAALKLVANRILDTTR